MKVPLALALPLALARQSLQLLHRNPQDLRIHTYTMYHYLGKCRVAGLLLWRPLTQEALESIKIVVLGLLWQIIPMCLSLPLDLQI